MVRAEHSPDNLRRRDIVYTAQPRTPGRLLTLNPFELGTEKDSSPRGATGSAPDVGCVDWYLYPVNRKPRAPESSRNALGGGGAPPGSENRLA
jgi:hypothetical protein